jgi:hypothetical protein
MKNFDFKKLLLLLCFIVVIIFVLSINLNRNKNLKPSIGKCILPTPFSCSISSFNTAGYLTITLQQNSGSSIRINRIACIDNKSIDTNTGLPNFATWTNLQIDLPEDSPIELNLQCKTGLEQFKGEIGSKFNGMLAINYTINRIMHYTLGIINVNVTSP